MFSIISIPWASTSSGRVRKLLYSSEMYCSAKKERGFPSLFFLSHSQADLNSVHTLLCSSRASAEMFSIISIPWASTSSGRVRKLLYSSEIYCSAKKERGLPSLFFLSHSQADLNSVHTLLCSSRASAEMFSIISIPWASTSSGRVRKLLYSSEMYCSASRLVQ